MCFTTKRDSAVPHLPQPLRACLRLPLPDPPRQPRSVYNDPGCHCLATYASQPITLLAPQINGALFLDHHGALWYVPALKPGHWNRRYATPVDLGHPLFDAADLIAGLLREAHAGLLPLVHLL